MNLDKLTASLRQHEGLRLSPYKDTTGNLTIGYGHLVANGISLTAAEQILRDDIGLCISQAQAQSWWQYCTDEDLQRAMVELVFELGVGGVAGFHDLIRCLGNSDRDGAARALLDSVYARQVGQRAVTLAGMIRG